LAGGEDIGTVVPSANPKIDPEYVIGSDPEIVILADAPPGAEAPQAILPSERPGWGNLTAVKEGKVYRLTEEEIDRISRPGPGLVDGLETLAKIIHPELFE
jgi:iron complex transport system substrate-binding protein